MMDAPDLPVVLVVDDSPAYLHRLGRALSSEFRVRVANSGQRGLLLAAQEPRPAVILLDVLMPGMDGHQVFAQLRTNPCTADIPVIFVTSLGSAPDELAGLGLGAADFIAKPAAPAVVQARVRTQVQLKLARDELKARNLALQAAVGDLEAFSYTVSHDLRAPLHAISGFAQALAESEAHALSAKGQHRLDRILQGARRMDSMIDDILACSRADRAQVQLHDVNLEELATDVVAQCAAQYPAAQVQVHALPHVQADPVLLRQVFENLVGNALKFSSGAARPVVAIEAATRPGWVEVSVRDNGAGFDPAYGQKLFGLFQRLHTEAEFPGSGVGLAIVKRVVTRHGGEVRAQSVPGGWTTFSFSLPSG
ncbi:MAG: response regulator [Burkholderiales bacterium]|nr:response regulator [Burkholderiales bacterium]